MGTAPTPVCGYVDALLSGSLDAILCIFSSEEDKSKTNKPNKKQQLWRKAWGNTTVIRSKNKTMIYKLRSRKTSKRESEWNLMYHVLISEIQEDGGQ